MLGLDEGMRDRCAGSGKVTGSKADVGERETEQLSSWYNFLLGSP